MKKYILSTKPEPDVLDLSMRNPSPLSYSSSGSVSSIAQESQFHSGCEVRVPPYPLNSLSPHSLGMISPTNLIPAYCGGHLKRSPSLNVPTEFSENFHIASILGEPEKNRRKDRKRPFKELPRDPEELPARFAAYDVFKPHQNLDGDYLQYRQAYIRQIQSQRCTSNPKMRRKHDKSERSAVDASTKSSESPESPTHKTENDSNSNDSLDNVDKTNNNESVKNNNNNSSNNEFSSCTDLQNGVVKDAAYWERRRKNNEAAKRSRDRRRSKEDEVTLRNAYLESRNIALSTQVDRLTAEIEILKSRQAQLVYQLKAYQQRYQECI